MGMNLFLFPSVPLAKTAGHLQRWCLKCKMHLTGELFHGTDAQSEILVPVWDVQPPWLGLSSRVRMAVPHSPPCSGQQELHTPDSREEDGSCARAGTTPGQPERQEQLIASDSNSPKTCPGCRQPFLPLHWTSLSEPANKTGNGGARRDF